MSRSFFLLSFIIALNFRLSEGSPSLLQHAFQFIIRAIPTGSTNCTHFQHTSFDSKTPTASSLEP